MGLHHMGYTLVQPLLHCINCTLSLARSVHPTLLFRMVVIVYQFIFVSLSLS